MHVSNFVYNTAYVEIEIPMMSSNGLTRNKDGQCLPAYIRIMLKNG